MNFFGFPKSVLGPLVVFLMGITLVELCNPKSNVLKVRPKVETGRTTDLGPMATSSVRHSVKTVNSANSLTNGYSGVRTTYVRGGKLNAHEKTYGTKRIGNPRLTEGISVLREQNKNVRITTTYKTGTALKGFGDMRTPQAGNETMGASQRVLICSRTRITG